MDSAISVEALYALLDLGAHKLLLDQKEIRALEAAADIDPREAPMGGVGWIEFKNSRWPAYCLSDELALTRLPRRARRVCALLSVGDELLGLLCDDLKILARGSFKLYPLPAAMRTAGTPVEALATIDRSVACVSSSKALAAFVGTESCAERGLA